MSRAKRSAGAQQHRRTLRSALQSAAQTHWRTAQQSLLRLLHTPIATAMTLAVIGIALVLPVGLLLMLDNVRGLSDNLGGISQVSVYLEDGVSDGHAQSLVQELAQRDDVQQARYVSPEEGAQEFIEYSGLGDILAALVENPLPGVIVLTPQLLDAAAAQTLQSALEGLPGVQSVQLDLAWVERLQQILALAGRAAAGLLLVLCLGVAFVTGNTIRLAIEGRRAEIVVVKLVGGTDADVALPFLYCGAFYGLGGAIGACLLLWFGMLLLEGPAQSLLTLYGSDFTLQGLRLGGVALLLAGGTLLGWLGAMLSVRQHLASIEPR
jgi:cell division transport system permease protein